ncbi:MAG TPA: valine--tRNA ligase [Candidatus Polarisedimenticolaceae bacterium]|nr:valine--tRNA ligase [Candidatus Polarisedimenticolaceae bacterium]
MSIEKEYRPDAIEEHWAKAWIERDVFRAGRDQGARPFCMVIPPPNVTGNLHMGHVLVYTLHDVIARWRRMQGWDVLWLPGTDHAGIATQTVVEKQLQKEGIDRRTMGREAFVARVWEWKSLYGSRITGQLKRLGASCDWSRERFTLDPGLSKAVRTVFVRLHREGLIYRDRAMVNWCPRCRTALSDLETIHETERGKLWTIRYPFADGRGGGIEVATTRPETMLGDSGVAVHPDDERYRAAVGRTLTLPLAGRTIPVVADTFVDPAFGTGAVKVTPAHDPNDFAAGRRLGLPEIVVIDLDGKMTKEAGEFAGLDRYQARKRVVSRLEEAGLLVGVREHEHAVGHCQRCGTVVEPLASPQWFVKVGPLAETAVAAVEQGRTVIVPPSWEKVYFEWMRNIHDWCISRQLWWGHRIPAWYCDACGTVEVHEDDPKACAKCRGPLRQDDDVLDTWFSSGLWPFSTLGWPESTADLARYYPTNLLITGFDIIFFWVARMMMLGLKFMGDVPFREVYIHGLVRDEQGQKMSKSKGNTIDPDDVQKRYGTDAVRLTMAMLAAPGNDIPLAEGRMEGYRAFANKLWNACRFVLLRLEGAEVKRDYTEDELTLVDRWILARTHAVIGEVDRALEQYRFDRAADTLYHFVWHAFCDWYIELVKPDLLAEGRRAEVARAVLLEVLDTLLRLLHPVMPFVTEELWQKIPHDGELLATAAWPRVREDRLDARAERDMELLQELIVKARNVRAEAGIDPSRRIDLMVHAENARNRKLVSDQAALVATLVRADRVEVVEAFPEGLVAARGVVRSLEVAIPLEGLLDFDAERTRLTRDLAKIVAELDARNRKLANESFLERAPAEVVEKERAIQKEFLEKKRRIEATLATLG